MRDNAHSPAENSLALRRSSLMRQVWCDGTLPDEMTGALLSDKVDQLLHSSIPLQVKDRCSVGRLEVAARSLLIKKHIWGGTTRMLRMAFRESAAHSCARLGRYLHNLGLPTPRPRAYVLYRFGPWTLRSYLITDYVPGTPLYQYIRYGSQSGRQLRHIAMQVARIWQQLSELGVSHGDFKPENFIVDENERVWLIDLERTRVGGKQERQRKRQVFDVCNFLHVRGWHRRPEARAVFAQAFLTSARGDWLRGTDVERVAAGEGLSRSEIDPELSVMIVCESGLSLLSAQPAIDSVKDIADEILLAIPTETHELEVIQRIEVASRSAGPASFRQSVSAATSCPASHDWVLALHPNEVVTPFLAKEIQQRIADANGTAAWRVPLEPRFFGQSLSSHNHAPQVRLFHRKHGTYDAGSNAIDVAADCKAVRPLIGTILVNECATVAKYIDRLNDQSSENAMKRAQAGEMPNLFRASCVAAMKFLGACLRKPGLRCGVVGLQIAALQSAFHLFEEAKLYQFVGDFGGQDAGTQPDSEGSVDILHQHNQAHGHQAKAA